MDSVCVSRETNETSVNITFNPNGSGNAEIKTGIGFFNHMFHQFSFHGGFDLKIECKGDVDIDCHHTVEDIGITLGQVFRNVLNERKNINRYGMSIIPMDEALTRTVVDISGRPALILKTKFPAEKIGDLETETLWEFFKAFVNESKITLHIETFYGENTHHIIESIFKSFGKSLSEAIRRGDKNVPSTKGLI